MAIRRPPDDESKIRQKYLGEISRYPVLTPEQERALGRVIRDPATDRARRAEAIDDLVRANLKFVVWYVMHKVRSPDVSFLDLISEGNIGLIQAAARFDPDRGVRFNTYAVWWVRQAISHALAEQTGAVRLPHKQASLASRVARVREALSRKLERDPTVEEIAVEADLSAGDVEMLLTLNRSSESLSRSIGSDQDWTLGDMLEQTSVASADDELLRRSSVKQTHDLLETLPKKERAVLCRRFGIPDDGSEGEREPMTLQEIGDELKLSRERVRQIEAQAILRLKRSLKGRTLKAYLN